MAQWLVTEHCVEDSRIAGSLSGRGNGKYNYFLWGQRKQTSYSYKIGTLNFV